MVELMERPRVQPSTIVRALTVTLPVEPAYTLDILLNDTKMVCDGVLDQLLRDVVEEPFCPLSPDVTVLAGYSTPYSVVIAFEPGYCLPCGHVDCDQSGGVIDEGVAEVVHGSDVVEIPVNTNQSLTFHDWCFFGIGDVNG